MTITAKTLEDNLTFQSEGFWRATFGALEIYLWAPEAFGYEGSESKISISLQPFQNSSYAINRSTFRTSFTILDKVCDTREEALELGAQVLDGLSVPALQSLADILRGLDRGPPGKPALSRVAEG